MPPGKDDEAKREERRKKVAANLLGGMTYRDMADALGCSLGTISNDVKIIIGRWQKQQVEHAEDYISVELRRLDVALNAIWNKVIDGDAQAIDRFLKIQERRARYLGLDKPIGISLTDDELLKKYRELVEAIGALGGGDQEPGADAAADDDDDLSAQDFAAPMD